MTPAIDGYPHRRQGWQYPACVQKCKQAMGQNDFSKLAASLSWGRGEGGEQGGARPLCSSIFSFFHMEIQKQFAKLSLLLLSAAPSTHKVLSHLVHWGQVPTSPVSQPLPFPFLICCFGVDLPGLCCSPGLPAVNFPWLYLWCLSSLLFNCQFCPA